MGTPALISLSKQMLMKRQLSVIANNIANVSTVGFKSENLLFAEHLAKAGKSEAVSFVRTTGSVRDRSMGKLSETTNPLDLAIQGKGYFAVETPFGTRYTRNGHFQMNELRQIISSDGHPLLSDNGRPITLQPDDQEVTISRSGEISSKSGKIGKIQLHRFADENSLIRMANGLYRSELPSEEAKGSEVLQGKLEQSNVEPISEITKMIELARAYESATKLIQGENDRKRRAIQTLTKMN